MASLPIELISTIRHNSVSQFCHGILPASGARLMAGRLILQVYGKAARLTEDDPKCRSQIGEIASSSGFTRLPRPRARLAVGRYTGYGLNFHENDSRQCGGLMLILHEEGSAFREGDRNGIFLISASDCQPCKELESALIAHPSVSLVVHKVTFDLKNRADCALLRSINVKYFPTAVIYSNLAELWRSDDVLLLAGPDEVASSFYADLVQAIQRLEADGAHLAFATERSKG